jgi:hypothetical protein
LPNNKITPILAITSWALYLVVFPFEKLLGGAPLFWILILVALAALVTSVLDGIHPAKKYAVTMLCLISLLELMYLAHWGKSILTMAPALKTGLIDIILHVLDIKTKLATMVFKMGQFWNGIAYSYWEIMPILQGILGIYWIRMLSRHSPAKQQA